MPHDELTRYNTNMSTTSYIRNKYCIRIVYYSYVIGGVPKFGKHVNYEKSDDKAIESAYKCAVWSHLPSFFVWGVKTIMQ